MVVDSKSDILKVWYLSYSSLQDSLLWSCAKKCITWKLNRITCKKIFFRINQKMDRHPLCINFNTVKQKLIKIFCMDCCLEEFCYSFASPECNCFPVHLRNICWKNVNNCVYLNQIFTLHWRSKLQNLKIMEKQIT